jgi:hypothetical protein
MWVFWGCGQGFAQKHSDSLPAIYWHTHYESACALAQETQLPLLLFFTCRHSYLCHRLHALFTHPDWVWPLRDRFIFVCLEEGEADKPLKDRYGVVGYPTLVVVSADQHKIGSAFYRRESAKGYAQHLLALLEDFQKIKRRSDEEKCGPSAH